MCIRSIFDKPKSITKFVEYSMRFYSEPKLSKPKELKGVNQSFSVDYIKNKCKCQIFIKDNDIWIKHRDYFSSIYKPTIDELGKPLNYFAEKFLGKQRPKKFIYGNAWGSVVLRNEAWIILKDLLIDIKNDIFILDILNNILRQMEEYYKIEKYKLCCTDMERFLERVISIVYNTYPKRV